MKEVERRIEADDLPGGLGVAGVLLKLARKFKRF